MPPKILIPLPRKDFDPTEVAVPWTILKSHGLEIVFATPDGSVPVCDQKMLTGRGLGLLAPLLMADSNATSAYAEMNSSPEFRQPIRWSEFSQHNFEGLLLPGGHDKGMREYLESSVLQAEVAVFFQKQKPVGAICHGVVLAARSRNQKGQSVLYGRKTTCLLETQELAAWRLTCLWLKDYYRTYSVTVEHEVRACLASQSDFFKGPTPFFRDSLENLSRGFFVRDGNFLSARWPGDAHAFASEFVKMICEASS